MQYLVEVIHPQNGQDKYISACKALGLAVRNVRLDVGYAEQLANLQETPVFGFGSIQLIQALQQHSKLDKSMANWAAFKCCSYYPMLGDYLLNRNFTMLPFGDVLRMRWELFRRHGVDTQVFIRPDDGTKSFTGAVIDLQQLETQINYWSTTTQSTELVVVANPQEIQGEWRFAVTQFPEPTILGTSLYRYQGNETYVPHAPPEAHKFVLEVLRNTKISPNKVFMLDVAELKDRSYRVVEINAISSAAPYSMDVMPILKYLTQNAS